MPATMQGVSLVQPGAAMGRSRVMFTHTSHRNQSQEPVTRTSHRSQSQLVPFPMQGLQCVKMASGPTLPAVVVAARCQRGVAHTSHVPGTAPVTRGKLGSLLPKAESGCTHSAEYTPLLKAHFTRSIVQNLYFAGYSTSLQVQYRFKAHFTTRRARPPLAVSASSGEARGQVEEQREVSDGAGEVLLAAWEILDNFNVCDIKGLPQPSLQSPEGVAALAASVQLAASAVGQEKGVLPLLGLCAGSPGECHVAAQEWTAALGFADVSQEASWQSQLKSLEGPVYLKLNMATRSCQASPYPGKYRGVIVQLADKQVGHLPLKLFQNSTS